MENKKPLVQARLDAHSLEHYFGSMILFLGLFFLLNIWDVPEVVSWILTFIAGVMWEIAQHSAYKSEESFDVLDICFNVAGIITGQFVLTIFYI